MKRALFGVTLVFSVLLIMSSAAFASEPRINVLTGGNDLSMPEDDLDVFNFPHTLAAKGNFVVADETSNYVTYAGSKWMASINRGATAGTGNGMNNITLGSEPIIDLGYSNGSTGIIANIGLTDANAARQILSLGARGSIGSDGAALAAEVQFIDDEAADTGLLVGGDARLDMDHDHFKYLIISGSFASKLPANALSKGGGTDIEVGALLADNDMVTDDVRLLYGIGVGVALLDKQTTAITIPTHIGAEIDAKKWLTVRAGGTRTWRMDSWDKTGSRPPNYTGLVAVAPDETTYQTTTAVAFGAGLSLGAVTADMTLRNAFLRDGIVFNANSLSAHTALTYNFQ